MSPERAERLREWRKLLEGADPQSRLGRLEAAHRRAGLADGNGHEFTRALEEDVSGELLDLIHMMLHLGVMPPPEFLLTVMDDWRAYLEADQSDMKEAERASLLERKLIGAPVKRAGNYAKRRADASTRLQKILNAHGRAATQTVPRDKRHDKDWREANMHKYQPAFESALEDSDIDIDSLRRSARRERKDK